MPPQPERAPGLTFVRVAAAPESVIRQFDRR
jgi:hypothetical protein